MREAEARRQEKAEAPLSSPIAKNLKFETTNSMVERKPTSTREIVLQYLSFLKG